MPQDPGTPAHTALPVGTITLLFTDIEGSTRLLDRLGSGYATVLARHNAILREAFAAFDGIEVDRAGDGFFVVFPRAVTAATAALAAQRALAAESWPSDVPVRVRMGLHTGEPALSAAGYVGMDVHRAARICTAAHGGQILLSETTRQLLQGEVPTGARVRDVGSHRLKDLQRLEHLWQLTGEGLPDEFPAVRSLAVRASNLPVQSTALVGRRHEVERVRGLFDEGAHLVTLTGLGGIGKTRVALQIAEELIDSFRDGAAFVPLAALSDASLVFAAIAQAVGVPEESSRSAAETLGVALANREMLLVLDNFEQILEAAPGLADLLSSLPQLRALVTSQVPLNVRGERVFPVKPLPVPDRRVEFSLANVSQFAAVQLFVQRAAEADPEFSIDARNAPAIAEICVRLDGLPLAIELAAARVKLFPPQALLDNLGSRLALLRGGARDMPARHQTLRDAIAWSYNLLPAPEQRLFRTLGVFVGGFTLDAVDAVWSGLGGRQLSALDGVAALLDKSLLRREDGAGPDPRYGMLETIREYAVDRLVDAAELGDARSAQAGFYLSVAERAAPHLTGPDQSSWMARLAADHDNARAAFAHAEEAGDQELSLRLANALWRLWVVRGPMHEGRARMEAILERTSEPALAPLRATALSGLATLSHELGDLTRSSRLLSEALELFEGSGDELGVARTITNLGWVAFHSGSLEDAEELSTRSLDRHRALGDRRGVALALNNLGWTANIQGRFAVAKERLEASLTVREELRDARGAAYARSNLGWTHHRLGRFEQALELVDQALHTHRGQDDTQLTAFALCVRGEVLMDMGRLEEAIESVQEGWTLAQDINHLWISGFGQLIRGDLALRGDRPEQARDCYRASVSFMESAEALWGRGRAAVGLGEAWRGLGDLTQALHWQRLGVRTLATMGARFAAYCGMSRLCATLADLGDAEGALTLLAACETLRLDLDVPIPVGIAPLNAATAVRAEAAIGTERSRAAADHGRRLAFDEAWPYALSRAGSGAGAAPDEKRHPRAGGQGSPVGGESA